MEGWMNRGEGLIDKKDKQSRRMGRRIDRGEVGQRTGIDIRERQKEKNNGKRRSMERQE